MLRNEHHPEQATLYASPSSQVDPYTPPTEESSQPEQNPAEAELTDVAAFAEDTQGSAPARSGRRQVSAPVSDDGDDDLLTEKKGSGDADGTDEDFMDTPEDTFAESEPESAPKSALKSKPAAAAPARNRASVQKPAAAAKKVAAPAKKSAPPAKTTAARKSSAKTPAKKAVGKGSAVKTPAKKSSAKKIAPATGAKKSATKKTVTKSPAVRGGKTAGKPAVQSTQRGKTLATKKAPAKKARAWCPWPASRWPSRGCTDTTDC